MVRLVEGIGLLKSLRLVYANERQLNTIDMVDKLRDLRIGVDAGYWIRRILTQIPREPCVVAMSGLPLGFEREVEKELRYFKYETQLA